MLRTGSKFGVSLALVSALAIPVFAQTGRKPAKPKPAAVRQQAPTPLPPTQPAPTPEPPPVPLRPEQMAPNPPQVTFQDSQLTIVADNSTLSSILSAVRVRTGASLDIPRDAVNDRVVARLGPGDPRDVLAALLQGSRFDYILLGSESDPNALSQIILTARAGVAGAPPAVVGTARPVAPPPAPADDEDTADTQPEPEPQPEPQPVQPQPTPSPAVASPVTPPPGPPEIGPTPPESQNPGQATSPQVKTPEQLLQELQRMRQQQDQNQQQQAPNRPQGPPRHEPPQ